MRPQTRTPMYRVHSLVCALISGYLAYGCANPFDEVTIGRSSKSARSTPATQRKTSGKVRLSLSATDTEKYLRFISGKQLTGRLSYASPDLDTAQALDAVLIAKALVLGGVSADFEFAKIPNSERERAMVLAGDVTVAGTSQWDFWADENAADVFKSDEVVPNGAFEKGLYTTRERADDLVLDTPTDLSRYSCVTNKSWRVDWNTLSRLGFKSLQAAPNTETMFKMVQGGHADLTVQSFSGLPDMSITVGGITLYPIKGWKVLLNGSRHYVVSKKNPLGASTFAALQKGLAQMKQVDEVSRALTESGFFNVNVRDWKSIQAR
ncbi:MAG: hypothetical protein QM784_11015 [Polyangiaceae bacterium]